MTNNAIYNKTLINIETQLAQETDDNSDDKSEFIDILKVVKNVTDFSENINFVSILKDNTLELQVMHPNNLMGKKQPEIWNRMYHEPYDLNTLKIDGLDILGNLDIFVQFVNKKGLNSCYTYTSNFPTNTLFGLSTKYTASTKYNFVNGSCKYYQESKSSIKFVNNSRKDISLKLFGGKFTLGKNMQYYTIDGLNEKTFIIKAKSFVNNIKILKIHSQPINISYCKKDPFKYKIDSLITFDTNNKHVSFIITSDFIEGDYIYDTYKNIKWRIMYRKKFLTADSSGYFFLKFKNKDQVVSFVPYCDNNTKMLSPSILDLQLFSLPY